MGFANKIKLGFYKRQAIYSAIIIFGILYEFTPPSPLKTGLFFAVVLSIILRLVISIPKLKDHLRNLLTKEKKEPIHVPEILIQAKRLGIKMVGEPIWINNKKGKALTNPITKQIKLYKNFYEKLNHEELKKIPVLLPSLPQQIEIAKKISELFSNLDITKNSIKNIVSNANKYKTSILRSALYGNLTKKWRNKAKNLSDPLILLKKIEDEKLKKGKMHYAKESSFEKPKLPNEWSWTSISNITESMKNGIYKSKSYYSEDGVICLRMYNIDDGKIIWKDLKKMKLTPEEIEEYGLKSGDILVNRVNSRELVGKAAPILPDSKECVFESKNIRLRLISKIANFQFVSYWFEFFTHEYFSKNVQQTVGMASINQEQLASMPIVLPSIEEQNQIVKDLEEHFRKMDLLIESAKNFQRGINLLQYSILKSAFSGKLIK